MTIDDEFEAWKHQADKDLLGTQEMTSHGWARLAWISQRKLYEKKIAKLYGDYDKSTKRIAELEAQNKAMREALVKLRDCDFVISLPDRMDSVRDIARLALDKKG